MSNVEDFNLYQYCQLVCRIGLRNNTGDTYRMYYSQDFDKSGFPLGHRLKEYINNNRLLPVIPDEEKWRMMVYNIPNGKRQVNNISKLLMSGIVKLEMFAIKTDIRITLDEINAVLPFKKKRVDNYDALRKVLNSLGITLEIDKK